VSLRYKSICLPFPHAIQCASDKIEIVWSIGGRSKKARTAAKIYGGINCDGSIRLGVRPVVPFSQIQQQSVAAEGEAERQHWARSLVPSLAKDSAQITGHTTVVGAFG